MTSANELFGELVSGVKGLIQPVGQAFGQPVPTAPKQKQYTDDLKFCQSFNGKNVLVTGATGAIGSRVLHALWHHSRPSNVGLFIRDQNLLPEEF